MLDHDKELSMYLQNYAVPFGHTSRWKEISILEQIIFYIPNVLISQTAQAKYGQTIGIKSRDALEKKLLLIQFQKGDSASEQIDKLCTIEEHFKLHQVPFADWHDITFDYCINYQLRFFFREAIHYDHLLTVSLRKFNKKSYTAEKRAEFDKCKKDDETKSMKIYFIQLIEAARVYPFLSNTTEEIKQTMRQVLINNYLGSTADLL